MELLESCYSPNFYQSALRKSPVHACLFFFKLVTVVALIETTIALWPTLQVLWQMDPEPLSAYAAAEMPDDMVLTFPSTDHLPFVFVNRRPPYAVQSPPWLPLPYDPYSTTQSKASLVVFMRNSNVIPKAKTWLEICIAANALFVILDNGVLACQYLFLYTSEEMDTFRRSEAIQYRTPQALEFQLLTEFFIQFHHVPHVSETVIMPKEEVVKNIKEMENSPFMAFLLRYKGMMGIIFSLSYWMASVCTAACFLFTVFFVMVFMVAPLTFCQVFGPLGDGLDWGSLLCLAIYTLPLPVLLEMVLFWEPPSIILTCNTSLLIYASWYSVVIRNFLRGFDPNVAAPPEAAVANILHPAPAQAAAAPSPAGTRMVTGSMPSGHPAKDLIAKKKKKKKKLQPPTKLHVAPPMLLPFGALPPIGLSPLSLPPMGLPIALPPMGVPPIGLPPAGLPSICWPPSVVPVPMNPFALPMLPMPCMGVGLPANPLSPPLFSILPIPSLPSSMSAQHSIIPQPSATASTLLPSVPNS